MMLLVLGMFQEYAEKCYIFFISDCTFMKISQIQKETSTEMYLFQSHLINNMDHIRISGTEPLSDSLPNKVV